MFEPEGALNERQKGRFDAGVEVTDVLSDIKSGQNSLGVLKNIRRKHYRYLGRDDSGTQQVTSWPETRSFTVIGINTTRTNRKQFCHRWKRIETAATQF